jgi:hypothetical protein
MKHFMRGSSSRALVWFGQEGGRRRWQYGRPRSAAPTELTIRFRAALSASIEPSMGGTPRANYHGVKPDERAPCGNWGCFIANWDVEIDQHCPYLTYVTL